MNGWPNVKLANSGFTQFVKIFLIMPKLRNFAGVVPNALFLMFNY
jgi:hypothetical protein